MSEAPWTLFWPRIGSIAAPQRPIMPHASIRLSSAVTRSVPLACCVSPMAHSVLVFARGPNTSTLWAMGLTQHANGTDLVTALLNLMLACGMIGRWGAAMLPIRGQNNVQGASDMGAIPFVYTDYRTVKDPEIRDEYARAWGVAPESLSLNEGLM